MLSLDEKKYIIKIYYKYGSFVAARRSFLTRNGYHAKNLPSISTIRYVVKKFERTGCVNSACKGKKCDITEDDVNRVARLYAARQRLSLRLASKKLELSTQKLRNILHKNLLKKAYRAKISFKPMEHQRKTRLYCATSLLNKKDILKNVWFTDESYFYSDGKAQLKQEYCWATSKDDVEPLTAQLYPFKVMVWEAVSSKGLIGPYYFHKNGAQISVTQESYQECILWFVEQLKKRRLLTSAYIMQDGAPPHTSISTKMLLRSKVGDKVVGKGFNMEWSPYSPDLTPAHFWLWPTVKRIIYSQRKEPFESVASLKRAITFAFNPLRKQKFGHISKAVDDRLERCIRQNGLRI